MGVVDLSRFVHGVHSVEKDGDRFRLHRLGPETECYFEDKGARYDRALSPSGVRCVFRGRLSRLICQFKVERKARSFAGMDLVREGLVIDHAMKEGVEVGDDLQFRFKVDPEIEGVYELWFPITIAGPIRVEIEGDVEPVESSAVRLLTIGDSITQGMVSSGPAGTYAALLARDLGADLRNQGIGGHVFDAQVVSPTEDWVPSLITVAYGTNDWNGGVSPKELQDNAAALLTRVTELFPEVPVLMATPLWRANWWDVERNGHTLRATSEPLFELASEGVEVIDGFELLPHHLRFTTDNLHPNDLGMMHVAKGLLPLASEAIG